MHFFLLSVAMVAVSTRAARLDNTYLPARGTVGAGVGFVNAPAAFSGGAGRFTGGAVGTGAVSAGRYSGGGAAVASGPVIPIISYENNPNAGDGVYSFSYETGNGITAQESGRQSSAQGPEGPGTAAQGSYSYKGPDGQTYTITYTADENGFHAQGDHLPTPPPIPPEILKSLQFQGTGSDGSGTAATGSGSYTPTNGGFTQGAGFRRPAPSFNPSTGYQYRK